MLKLPWLLRLVGMIQIILGVLYLFAPSFLLKSMGHSLPNADIFYPLGMLGARFVTYGIALLYISSNPTEHRLWLVFMVLIQLIDLAVGVFYTITGVVPLALSGFPMFNAVWISVFLWLWMPKKKQAVAVS